MDKAVADQIMRLTQRASHLLDQSVDRVLAGAPDKGANVYRSSVGRAMGEMAFILFHVWREHPDLEPASMRDSTGAYNPRDFEIPPDVAAEALASLHRAAELLNQVDVLIGEEADAAEREVYAAEVGEARRALAEATNRIQRRG